MDSRRPYTRTTSPDNPHIILGNTHILCSSVLVQINIQLQVREILATYMKDSALSICLRSVSSL